MSEPKPVPGSFDAIALGCLCPMVDNQHRRRQGRTDWIYDDRCPLHGDGREPIPA